jgi:hypothetical protein
MTSDGLFPRYELSSKVDEHTPLQPVITGVKASNSFGYGRSSITGRNISEVERIAPRRRRKPKIT